MSTPRRLVTRLTGVVLAAVLALAMPAAADRFAYVSPTFDVEIAGASRDVETRFTTHSIVIGASFRF